MAVTTIDLKRELAPLYAPKAEPAMVDVPELSFLMVDGRGDPSTAPAYGDAVSALYSLAYGVRFALKKAGIEYTVMPLEGLWSAEDMSAFTTGDRDAWEWTLMIAQPEQVTADDLERARSKATRKAPADVVAAVRLERFAEGRAAQVLHTGPYAEEGPTIARLHRFIHLAGCGLRGRHHEIYLGDPRRTDPLRLRTVLRQPVEPPAA